MGTRGPHYLHVLVLDYSRCDQHQRNILFLYWPCRPRLLHSPRTPRICGLVHPEWSRYRFHCYDCVEPVASRRSLGEFCVKATRIGVQHSPLLQLYRCHAICGMNYWVIALPCLLYLASVGTSSSPPVTSRSANAPIQRWVSHLLSRILNHFYPQSRSSTKSFRRTSQSTSHSMSSSRL